METHQQYKARIQGLVTGKDPVTVQRQTPSQLAALISGVAADKLSTRPAPNAWSVTEILAHLSEAEITASWRYRQMLEHDGCPLAPYGQELWAELGGYAQRDPADSLQLFRSAAAVELADARQARRRNSGSGMASTPSAVR